MQWNLNYMLMSTQVFNLCTDPLAGLHVSGLPRGCMLMRRPGTPAEALFWQVNTKLTLMISVNCSFISVKRFESHWNCFVAQATLSAFSVESLFKKLLISHSLKGSENNCSIQPNLLCFSRVCCCVEEVVMLLYQNPLWALNSTQMLHYSMTSDNGNELLKCWDALLKQQGDHQPPLLWLISTILARVPPDLSASLVENLLEGRRYCRGALHLLWSTNKTNQISRCKCYFF